MNKRSASVGAGQGFRKNISVRLLIGLICLAAGAWILGLAIIGSFPSALTAEKTGEQIAGDPGFPALGGHYSADRIDHYRLRQGEEVSFPLDAVSYRAADGERRRAVLYPGLNAATVESEPDALFSRRELWANAMEALNGHAEENALFLTWWDNAQRIDWFTGRTAWADAPIATAFADRSERQLWAELAGPFAGDETRLRQLARWLTMNAHDALAEMAATLPAATPVYFLVCLDDLARLAEIERLAGKKPAFEAAQFPRAGDIHAQIAEVKRWAQEKGSGSYLLQNTPGGGIRAWRIENAETGETLLAKLLPFTGSLEKPLAELETVYQSSRASYLTVLRWNR